MNSKEKLNIIDEELEKLYPITSCFLHYTKDYELLFAILLSAQTTDISVNKVTDKLFNDFKSLKDYVDSSINVLETYLKPLGLSKTKANNLYQTANILYTKYNGIIPRTREELITLPGVGYKTATVFLSELYNYPSIPVDTHIKRIVNRLNVFNKEIDNPDDISKLLDKNYQKNNHIELHRRLILFGRNICTARNPNCNNCPFKEIPNFCKNIKIKAV